MCIKKDTGRTYALKQILKRPPRAGGSRLRSPRAAFINETNILTSLNRRVLGGGAANAGRDAKSPRQQQQQQEKEGEEDEGTLMDRRARNHILLHHHSFEGKNHFFIVTELCAGVSLFDRIISTCGSRTPFTERGAARLASHMLVALRACHVSQIVHRDIKPENFLFAMPQPDAPLKLIDYGEAVRSLDEHIITDIAGSEYYLAPEVLPTQRDSFGRTCREWKAADMWSIGVVIYVCLFGRPPFSGRDTGETFHKIKTSAISLPRVPYFSKTVYKFLSGLLVRDTSKRMTVAEALRHPWVSDQSLSLDKPIPQDIIKSLRRFKKHCRIKRAVGRILANRMTKSDKEKLEDMFERFDKDKKGRLSVSDLTDFMRHIQDLDSTNVRKAEKKTYVYGETEAKQLLWANNRDTKDSVTKEEFVEIFATQQLRNMEKSELKTTFELIDQDRDGFITSEELQASCGFMTPRTARDIVRETADDSKTERISFGAFLNAMATPVLRRPTGTPMSGPGSEGGGQGVGASPRRGGSPYPPRNGGKNMLNNLQAPLLNTSKRDRLPNTEVAGSIQNSAHSPGGKGPTLSSSAR